MYHSPEQDVHRLGAVMMNKTSADPRITRTRSRVIDAALELLSEAGPEAVTHQRVAELAGVGRATVYRHWPERWLLIRDALESLSLQMVPPEGLCMRDSLVCMLEQLCDQLESPASTALGSLITQAEWDPESRVLLDRITANASAGMPRLLERGAREDGLRVDVPPATALALIAGPFFFERYVMGRVSSRAHIRAMVDGLLDRWGT